MDAFVGATSPFLIAHLSLSFHLNHLNKMQKDKSEIRNWESARRVGVRRINPKSAMYPVPTDHGLPPV